MAEEIENYFDRLWTVCRSITGNGVRQSLAVLSELIPLQLKEIPTGTKVGDWEVPQEWNITDAYIITPAGEKICDFRENNLHVISYAVPVNAEVSWNELEPHLFTRPDLPTAVPYVTSYYERKWGFCLTHEQWLRLPREGKYRVVIESSLEDGNLTIGEAVLPGSSGKEVLFSTYICHPSMANNELSGPLVAAFLYRKLAAMKERKFTYRFVFTTETIGTLAFLSGNGMKLKKDMVAGWILTCCGTDKPLKYKRSARENSLADTLSVYALKKQGNEFSLLDFEPVGSDERQYCSPGYDLPVGSFMTSVYHQYPEYHTSLDNKSLVSFEAMQRLVVFLSGMIEELEATSFYANTVMFGEPALGKRGLYPSLALSTEFPGALRLRMRVLHYFNGERSVLEFCEKFGYNREIVMKEIQLLLEHGLLRKVI